MPHWLQLMIDPLGPLLWAGLVFTVPLTILSFVLGLGLGLVAALGRLFGPWPLAAAVRFYVWIIRGTPLLVQLFLIFYGLPSVGILLDAFTAALIGFTLNIGAYTSEIIRAAISSVAKGQWEASFSIGMSWGADDAAHDPAAGSKGGGAAAVQHLHLAGQGHVAGGRHHRAELFQAAQRIVAATYEPLILYIEAALIYLAISSVLSALQARLETRLNRYGGFLEARA